MKISDKLLARLQKTKERSIELGEELSKGEVVSNQELFKQYSKELSELTPIVVREYNIQNMKFMFW